MLNIPKIKIMTLVIATLQFTLLGPSAMAGERESLEQLRATTTNLVNLLVQEGVLNKNKADALLAQAKKDAEVAKSKEVINAETEAATDPAIDNAIDKKMVRVQYVPEIVKQEMKEDIKKEVMAKLNMKAGTRLGMPEWIDQLTWEGDIRVRYQRDNFGSGNPSADTFNFANNLTGSGFDLNNTTEDRNRARIRARLGVSANVNDWVSAGVRITTGGLNDPISPNQTQETASAKYTIGLDRAFVKLEPKPRLNVVAGRFANPWFSTDLVWDPDLAFDGVAASYTHKFNDKFSVFGTAGVFPLDEIEGSDLNKASSKWLYGSQVGIKWAATDTTIIKLAMGYYDFQNVQGKSNPTGLSSYDATTPVYRTKGNTAFDINEANNNGIDPATGTTSKRFGLASKFKEVNLTGQIDIAAFDPVHVILTGDYVRNIGFDSAEIVKRTGVAAPKKEVNAYQVKLAVGMPETLKARDWQVFGAYKRLEADSVVDAYTDSDFYLGGTNAKGWILGGSYGLDKNTWISARWFSADEITPRVASNDPLSIDVFMIDLNAKF